MNQEAAGATGDHTGEPRARFGPWRREARAALELIALTGIAVAQPVLDIVGNDATGVFVTRDAGAAEIVAFAAIVVLAPPAVLWLLEVVVGLIVPRARPATHVVLCAALAGIIAVEVLKGATGWSATVVAGVAIGAGVAAGACIARFGGVRLFLRYLALAPFAFAVLFLVSSPVTPIVLGTPPEAANGVRVGTPSRVVMVVMDEFPLESLLDGTGHVDAARYPNFAALERGSTWYRNTTTVSPSTETAVPAILTGDYPSNELVPPVASEYPRNLFTLLGGAYRMNVHEPYTRLCPESLCERAETGSGAGGGIAGMLDDATSAWTEFASPEPTPGARPVLRSELSSDEALGTGNEFVESLRPASAAQLDFVHVVLPHSPWQFLGDDQNFEPEPRPVIPGILTPELRWRDEFAAESNRQRHLLQVQVADRLLGRIVAKLQAIDAYEDSLLVVTADHGGTFTADNMLRGLSQTSYPEIMWTPLFVKAPGQQAGEIDDIPVRSIDVLPTIADQLDVELPWDLDGTSTQGPRRTVGPLRISSTIWDTEPLPPGQEFHEFDGAAGFERVLRARATDAGPDDSLALYRFGPFGGLVGSPVAPLVETTSPEVSATFDDDPDYDDVDPDAAEIPWAELRGTVGIGEERRPIAIGVNGVVAGVTETSGRVSDDRTAFAVVLPPELFRRGRNDVRIYVVSGTPEAPRLTLAPVEPG